MRTTEGSTAKPSCDAHRLLSHASLMSMIAAITLALSSVVAAAGPTGFISRLGLEASLGVCCIWPEGTCYIVTEEQCAAAGGTWHQELPSCDPNPCPRVVVVQPDGQGDYPTIQAAIDDLPEMSWVLLTDGTFSGDGNRDIDFLGKAITVKSQSGDSGACIVDCGGTYDQPHRGFHFHNGEGPESILEGVTITNANQAGEEVCDTGGAVRCDGTSAPLLSSCRFVANEAGSGAGVACTEYAAPNIVDCVFDDNDAHCRNTPGAGRGGGLFCQDHASPSVVGCLFSRNGAYRGGGVNGIDSASVTLMECVFDSNRAGYYGGGIATSGTCSLAVQNCTFVENSVGGFGSSIASWSNVEGYVENTIVAFDGFASDGAVIGGARLSCCDLFGNAGGDWVGDIAGQYGIDGNFSADPIFCDRENGDLTLHADSPCLPGNHPDGYDCGLIGAFGHGCGVGSDVQDDLVDGNLIPRLIVVPNPSQGVVGLWYSGVRPSRKAIAIFDAAGRRVRSYDAAAPTAKIIWDRTDSQGNPVASGAYFVRLVAGDRKIIKRVLLLR